MRPPICDVCGADASEGGALVRAVSSSDDVTWRERAEREGLVGHPPDTGWFCADHVGLARQLAPVTPLPGVLQALRKPDAGAGSPPEPTAASAGVGVGALYGELRTLLPGLVADLGLDSSAITVRTDRHWHPMDGSQPPDCPFADSTVHELVAGEVRVILRLDSSWWNQDQQARSDVALSVRGAGAADFTVTAWSAASGAPDAVEGVKVAGNPPPAVVALVATGRDALAPRR